jgi:predicted metalloprotease
MVRWVVATMVAVALVTVDGSAISALPGNGVVRDPVLDPNGNGPPPASGRPYKDTVEGSVADIEEYWAATLPSIYGSTYPRLPRKHVVAARPGKRLPKCVGSFDEISGTATYVECDDDAYVVYDDERYFRDLQRQRGDFSITVVLARTWGRRVQRLGGVTDQVDPVVRDLQADCFAGAFTGWVQGQESRVQVDRGILDRRALSAILSVGDRAEGGEDLDRVSALQDGIDAGAMRCAGYPETPPSRQEIPFSDEQDAANGGNLPSEDLLPLAVELLDGYSTQLDPGYGPLLTVDSLLAFDSTGPKRRLPTCGGVRPTRRALRSQVFYCPDDFYIGFDKPYLQEIYDDIGDFGVITVLARAWASYVQVEQRIVDPLSGVGIGMGDCYAGGFVKAVYDEQLSSALFGGGTVLLSRGDLDEAIAAFTLNLGNSTDVGHGTAIDRLATFKQGFLTGYASCVSTADAGG